MTIKERFKELGLTTTQYARKIGVHQSTVSRVLNGTMPSQDTMYLIAKESGWRVMPIDFYPRVKTALARREARKAMGRRSHDRY